MRPELASFRMPLELVVLRRVTEPFRRPDVKEASRMPAENHLRAAAV